MLGAGTITEATLVWHEGLAGWQPLREARPKPAPPLLGEAPPVATTADSAASEPAGEPVRCHVCGGRFTESDVIRFGSTVVCAGCKSRYLQGLAEGAPTVRPTGGRSAEEILAARCEVKIGPHWDRAWAAFRQRPGLALGTTVVAYFLIGLASAIPLVSMVAPILIQGPLFGGVFLVCLGMLRNQPVELGTLFDGFRRGYWQLVVAQLVQGLIIAALAVPLAIIGVAPLFAAFAKAMAAGTAPGPALASGAIAWGVLMAVLIGILCMLVGALWMFSLPLIADRRLAFWPAMELSRKLAWQNFGRIVLFVIVLALINLAGAAVLCVGLLVTLPVSSLMLASLFDEMCGDLDPAKA